MLGQDNPAVKRSTPELDEPHAPAGKRRAELVEVRRPQRTCPRRRRVGFGLLRFRGREVSETSVIAVEENSLRSFCGFLT